MPASQTKEEVIDEFVHPAEPEPVETEEIVGVEAPRVFNLGGNEEGLLPDDMDDVVKTFNPEEEVHEVIDDLDVPSVSEQKVPTADEELNVDEFFERLATHKRNGAIPRVDGVIELPPAPEPEVVGPDDGLDELIEEVKGYKLTEPISGLDEVDFQSVSGPAVDEPVVSEKGLVVVPPAPTAEPTPEENGILSNESIYPMRLSNDVSMYKKKSELEGISDDLVGKWVVKNKDGKYVDIDKATDFEPEQAILVLPDNAIIDEKTGSYSIPDDSELPKNYQENEFKKERKEEQLEVVDSHKNWFLEQKIKLQKNLRVVLGVVSLAAATSAIALGTGGLSVAVPVGAMAFNLIDGITNTPERLAVSDAKQLYKEAKKLVNNHSDEIGETTTKNIVNQAKKIQEMKERIKANKKNGSLQMSEIEALEKMNQALADHLDQVYGYSEEEPKGRRR